MHLPSALRAGLAKVFVYALLALFLIPALTYGFTVYAQRDQDANFVAGISQRIDAEKGMPPAEKQARKDYYRSNPPSTICSSTDPDAQDYREALCERYSDVWQFHMARAVSFWTLVASGVLLVAVLGLGALAFADRTLQYTSFVAGWRLTTCASASRAGGAGGDGGVAVVLGHGVLLSQVFAQAHHRRGAGRGGGCVCGVGGHLQARAV
jgi:hypothetical protein